MDFKLVNIFVGKQSFDKELNLIIEIFKFTGYKNTLFKLTG